MIHFARHALDSAPNLRAAWLIRRNRWRRPARSDIAYRAAGAVAWLLATGAMWLAPASFGSLLAGLGQHPLLLALAAGWAGVSLTTRRRALARSEAPRSWLAALPVAPPLARVENVVLTTSSVLWAAAAVTLAFLTAMIVALAERIPAKPLTVAYGAVIAGLALGATLSWLVPLARPEILPPGSRYVPKRGLRRARAIEPSLAALGIWAVRHVFASARPEAVTRATIPILLLMPLGTFADAAMLVLAIAALTAALLMLVVAMITVYVRGARWLEPLPVRRAALVRHLVVRPLAAACLASVTLAWLLWVFHTYAGKR